MKFTEIAEHFNPAWFAAVLGTAVIPLVLSFLDFPFKEFLAAFFFLTAVLMFLVALAPWTVKFFLYRENIGKDLNHPLAAHFFPTMPISLVILAMDFLKYPDLLLPPEESRALAFWLWLLGSLCIASAVTWKVTGFASIFYFFILATVFMLIVWLVVFLRTAKGMASGKIFLPVH